MQGPMGEYNRKEQEGIYYVAFTIYHLTTLSTSTHTHHGPIASASPVSFPKFRISDPTPDLLTQNLDFGNISR